MLTNIILFIYIYIYNISICFPFYIDFRPGAYMLVEMNGCFVNFSELNGLVYCCLYTLSDAKFATRQISSSKQR